MITRSKYAYSSSSKAKAWLLTLKDFRAEFRTKKEAEAAANIDSQFLTVGTSLSDFSLIVEVLDHQGQYFGDFPRNIIHDGGGMFRIVSTNRAMESDEVLTALDLLARIA